MIKAIFFDWLDTLARYEPPREKLFSQALRESGIEISPKELMPGFLAADKYYLEENARLSIAQRSPREQAGVFMRYQNTVLTKAGVKVDQQMLLQIMKKTRQLFEGMILVLFDDVLSILKTLKERKLILGLLTNATKDMISVSRKLGLEPYLNFVITSQEVGADKPKPPIFLAALERAGVKASEAIHVGDQYEVDITGAQGVGIKPILIDRNDLYPEVVDCPRIGNLAELVRYL